VISSFGTIVQFELGTNNSGHLSHTIIGVHHVTDPPFANPTRFFAPFHKFDAVSETLLQIFPTVSFALFHASLMELIIDITFSLKAVIFETTTSIHS
jgi:hypothetical protein